MSTSLDGAFERSGHGLFGGRPCRVALRPRAGEILLRGAPLRGYQIARTLRTNTLENGSIRASCVEHLFAALAAAGVYRGLSIEMDGDEMPLLDGGASAWCEGLALLDLERSPPALAVLRDEEVTVSAGDGSGGETTTYRFFSAPSTSTNVRVHVDFGDARLARSAEWGGGFADFSERIAPARTFVFARDIEDLLARGLGAHAPPSSVIVIADDAVHAAGRAFSTDEPARHKLLDLIGDLFFYGGPPLGRIEAERPGHAATHSAMRIALASKIVGPT
jgi:UDP-3-O-[3-hydroxymyristoyl] N-acetylglucosamine deacetylase